VAVLAFGMIALGMLCFASVPVFGTWALYIFVLFFGIGYGGLTSLRPALTREYFGGARFGSIFGLIVGINAVGGITGPPLAGWYFDTWGDYRMVWIAFAVLAVVAAFLVLASQTYKPRGEHQPGSGA
jgi:MFS family permease